MHDGMTMYTNVLEYDFEISGYIKNITKTEFKGSYKRDSKFVRSGFEKSPLFLGSDKNRPREFSLREGRGEKRRGEKGRGAMELLKTLKLQF